MLLDHGVVEIAVEVLEGPHPFSVEGAVEEAEEVGEDELGVLGEDGLYPGLRSGVGTVADLAVEDEALLEEFA